MAVPGEIYFTKITYEEDQTKYKKRPVLVINAEEDICTIVEITSVSPRKPPTQYDQFKEAISDFAKVGLKKRSFVRTHRIHNVSSGCLKKCIGEIGDTELIHLQALVVQTFNRLDC